MSTFSCPIVQVGKIGKHPNATNLSITHVAGNACIVRNGEFEEGKRAVFIPEESLVPETEQWAFLWYNRTKDNKPVRETDRAVKAKKLRGIFSCGILQPVPEDHKDSPLGTDLAGYYGITKYEVPEQVGSGGDNAPTPGWLPKFTDIENARGFLFNRSQADKLPEAQVFSGFTPNTLRSDCFKVGESVVITEKIHGCLPFNGKVVMADGSRKAISKIQVGELVLGRTENGQVVSSEVLEVHNNGKADKWLRIETTRTRMGNGNSYAAVVCTPNHEIAVEGRYKEAGSLKVGDTVFLVREDPILTPSQEQVLLGKMLGDGHLHRSQSGTAAVCYGHKDSHKDYLDWTDRFLGEMATGSRNVQVSGYGTQMVRTTTKFTHAILNYFQTWGAERKSPPPEVANQLGPIALAFWYMDDGSLGHSQDQEDRALFATCGFTKEECSLLVRGFARFGITAVDFRSGDYWRIRLNEVEAEKFFLLVAPYIPQCMQYKLPERYRGGPGWAPSFPQEYKKELVPQKVTRIDDVTSSVKSSRFDLTTTTHNYFAHGILVHNSNARYAYHDGQFIIGSHANVKANDSTNWWTFTAKDLGMEERCKKCPGYILFGEVYGQVQKGYQYGLKKPTLVLFDAYSIRERKYVDWDFFVEMARELELPHVPILYKGPWVSLEHAVQFSDGPTVLGKGIHNREGCVVRTNPERFDEYLGRMVLKIIGETYLLSKYSHE